MSRTSSVAWFGTWSSQHNNVRWEALLPRLSSVHCYRIPVPGRWPLRGLYGRLEQRVLKKDVYPRLLRGIARRHPCLLCTQDWQIPCFPGTIIADDDDPDFSPQHISLLNRRNVAVVVTTSNLLRDRLREAGLTKECLVIPSGVHLSHLSAGKAARVRARLRKREDEVVVGFGVPYIFLDSDLTPERSGDRLRSVTFLLEAMERAWAEMPSLRLWLLGEPSRSVRAKLHGHPAVRLLGYVPHADVLDYYANIDIAVYPRLADMRGRHSVKVLEFMACGCPVVSTPVSESYLISQSGAGIIASGTADFASAILRLARDARLRRELGARGARFASAYDWDILAQRYGSDVLRPILDHIQQGEPA